MYLPQLQGVEWEVSAPDFIPLRIGNQANQDPYCTSLCSSEGPALGRRSSTSATLLAVRKCTGRHRTCEHTCAGIQGSDLLSAAGCSAGKGSHAVTSCRDIGEHTQVRFFLSFCPLCVFFFLHQEEKKQSNVLIFCPAKCESP